MVYALFALFLDVLMIPFLRASTSLENTVKTDLSEMLLLGLLNNLGFIVLVGDVFLFCVLPVRARGTDRVAGAIKVVVIGDSGVPG